MKPHRIHAQRAMAGVLICSLSQLGIAAGPVQDSQPQGKNDQPGAVSDVGEQKVDGLEAAGQEVGGQEEGGLDGLAINENGEFPGIDLEQLMKIDVTTVTGVGQTWFTTPAAMTVITGEDIRKTGHRSIPEALRLVPGMFVGQTNAHGWSIGARGFNGGLANKMLVLIDGRVVYDPLFSGTFWDVQDAPMEELDRIEVIRGPGATLWGANAMNGVVNVITKSARETQGWMINAGAGNEDRLFGTVRYGGELSESAWFRVWGKAFERDSSQAADGGSAHDDWTMGRGGLRLDYEGADHSFFMLQTHVYSTGRWGQAFNPAVPGEHLLFAPRVVDGRASGGHVLARLGQERPRAEGGSGWSLQAYYDRTDRVTSGFEVTRDTGDIDFRQHFLWGERERQELVWGLGARYTRDRAESTATIALDPERKGLATYSAFVQNTSTLVPQRLFFMIGSKFEHNDYTGFEFQPSARAWWTPSDNHTFWGAVSRPVRVPSRLEREGIITLFFADPGLQAGGAPTGVIEPFSVFGDDDVDAERATAYEVGHRVRLSNDVTLDTALFYNDYDKLIFVPTAVFGSFNNDGSGETYGGEITATWRVAEHWELQAAYSYVDVQIHGPIAQTDELATPHHMAHARSSLDLTDDLQFNTILYYVDRVPSVDADSYFRLDAGLRWFVNSNFELALWGQNLLDETHREFSALEVERSYYLMGTIRF